LVHSKEGVMTIFLMEKHAINPSSGSWSCDARMCGCHTYGLIVPHSPIRPPIRKYCLPQSISQWCTCISSMISRFRWTLSVLKLWKSLQLGAKSGPWQWKCSQKTYFAL
jgi:hypothetical protein